MTNLIPPVPPRSDASPKKNLKRWIWLLPLVLFLALAVLLNNRLGHDPAVVINARLEQSLPNFSLKNLTTQAVMTSADLPKKPFLLNVWATWCPTCSAEHAYLNVLASQGVAIVGVNYKDEREPALKQLEIHGDPYVFSLEDTTGSYGIDLGLTGAPETFVIDAQGKIRQHLVGALDEVNYQQKIKPCLEALASAQTSATRQSDLENKACQ